MLAPVCAETGSAVALSRFGSGPQSNLTLRKNPAVWIDKPGRVTTAATHFNVWLSSSATVCAQCALQKLQHVAPPAPLPPHVWIVDCGLDWQNEAERATCVQRSGSSAVFTSYFKPSASWIKMLQCLVCLGRCVKQHFNCWWRWHITRRDRQPSKWSVSPDSYALTLWRFYSPALLCRPLAVRWEFRTLKEKQSHVLLSRSRMEAWGEWYIYIRLKLVAAMSIMRETKQVMLFRVIVRVDRQWWWMKGSTKHWTLTWTLCCLIPISN